jgi:hypothetical protein
VYDTIQPQFDCRGSRDLYVVGELGIDALARELGAVGLL